MSHGPESLTDVVADAMAGDGRHAARRWAASGAMALTGPADGQPEPGPARVALAMDALALDLARTTAALGATVHVDGAALLGERAALTGFSRRGAVSCGGACRLLRTADGEHVAVSLVRDDDWTLLPALFAVLDSSWPDGGGWPELTAAVARVAAVRFMAATALLGLPCSRLGESVAAGPLVTAELTLGPRRRRAGVTIVDLSSLWAGPLCANLLGLAGARVVKVESTSRPDGARFGPPAFFELLHDGHEHVALDFSSERGRTELRRLISGADVVIEASRPRALATLGASYEHVATEGWRGVWLSITGHGRRGAHADRVAFGDDAAVAGGLVAGMDAARPMFCGDAIADPATGLLAAAAVARALVGEASGLIAVSLATTAAHLAAGVATHPSVSAPPDLQVALPHARRGADRLGTPSFR